MQVVDLTGRLIHDEERETILQTIRKTLAQGRCVLIKAPLDNDNLGWTWSKASFRNMTGWKSLDKPVKWMGKQVTQFSHSAMLTVVQMRPSEETDSANARQRSIRNSKAAC